MTTLEQKATAKRIRRHAAKAGYTVTAGKNAYGQRVWWFTMAGSDIMVTTPVGMNDAQAEEWLKMMG